ncbi:hypothetical protein [Clostridium sp.]|uniref:hypothetical protein n=1 Tax=Clostridium sp. TaxID=1506 RepID=UPI003D6CCFE4
MTKNEFSFVIYILSTVLILALSTFIFRAITHISYINDSILNEQTLTSSEDYGTGFSLIKTVLNHTISNEISL